MEMEEKRERKMGWEYHIRYLLASNPELLTKELNKLGEERWELAAVSGEKHFIFKRPKKLI